LDLLRSKREDGFKRKLCAIYEALGFPFEVMLACLRDKYRKPDTGMFQHIKSLYPKEFDRAHSFYVGDAAGRRDDNGKKLDHSDCDLEFAKNVGIAFHLPEDFFGIEHAPVKVTPSKALQAHAPLFVPSSSPLCVGHQELIVFIGHPYSGKTSFALSHLEPQGYHILSSQDKIRSALQKGHSVVADMTNPRVADRIALIRLANEFGIKCRYFHFQASADIARQLSKNHQVSFGAILT
jgi:bifunctional polynucleotide phosphatase/kinase